MTHDINDNQTIGRNFTMLSNLVVLQKMEARANPRNLNDFDLMFDRAHLEAGRNFADAKTFNDAYAVKFLASGAHLREAPNPHALPEDVRQAAEPLETFLDGQYRLRNGLAPVPAQRRQMLEFLNEYTRDKDGWAIPDEQFARAEREELNAILPLSRERSIHGLLMQRETGTGNAAAQLRAEMSRRSVAEPELSRAVENEEDFMQLPAMIESFRESMNEQLTSGSPLFDPAHNPAIAAHDPQAHGPEVDFGAASHDPALRRQAIGTLTREIALARDPLIEEMAREAAGRLAASRLSRQLAGPGAGLEASSSSASSSSGFGSDGPDSPRPPKRARYDERLDDRSRDSDFSL